VDLKQCSVRNIATGMFVNTGNVCRSSNTHRFLLCTVFAMEIPLEQACECVTEADELPHVTDSQKTKIPTSVERLGFQTFFISGGGKI
jgi:hypothetical protein